ncbi:MFS family permease [Agromyces flavus]|uniref:MFS family permease n=1 Tax=Agromyces flavus TaxID=589382 RepID=A0A1H1ZYT2_9MICO|nr:MFS transporter [Agromyces flavus]MCP2367347.1 MFS family permease [Agromyces flavus]GGI45908.1 putative transporter [Agromyces flavus]SDT38925.1 Predicted arabinose efflux permease, MFS family [Agromyces flavus]
MTTPRALRPLRNPAYRWLAAALVSSLIGTGVWIVALVWQIVAIGGGAAELSLVAGASAVGMLLTTLLGGALADRMSQRRILLVVEVIRAASVGMVALLSLAGALATWQLAAVAFVGGVLSGLYYPAYSALLPTVVPEDELLAANGFEGMARPVLMQAGGPALASALIAVTSPGAALAVTALSGVVAAACILRVPETAGRGVQAATAGAGSDVRGDANPSDTEPSSADDAARHPALALLVDVRDGFAYMVHTPWLLGTLMFASLLILLIMGPFEVLVPFVIKDVARGGPEEHALVLAAFGIGGAVGSAVIASLRMPRRYLTVMNLLWALGCLPLIAFGLTDEVWVMVVAAFLVGAAFNGGVVIWGTLLQRRVPAEMLGRVSSLDFFVSLAFMPLSMALAGPAGESLGLPAVFLIAGAAPLVIGVVAIVAARMTRDELANPLAEPQPEPEPATGAERSPEPEREPEFASATLATA